MREKTPKRFDWTIETASLDPAWPFGAAARPSRFTVRGWTWRNPDGFSNDRDILRVDQMTVEFDLASVFRAVRDRHQYAVRVSEVHLKGVHFVAERNDQDALNLAVPAPAPDAGAAGGERVEAARRRGDGSPRRHPGSPRRREETTGRRDAAAGRRGRGDDAAAGRRAAATPRRDDGSQRRRSGKTRWSRRRRGGKARWSRRRRSGKTGSRRTSGGTAQVALDLPDDDENVIARRFAEQRRAQRGQTTSPTRAATPPTPPSTPGRRGYQLEANHSKEKRPGRCTACLRRAGASCRAFWDKLLCRRPKLRERSSSLDITDSQRDLLASSAGPSEEE